MSSRVAFSCVASDAAVAAAEHLTALAFCDHTCKHESAAGPPHHFDQRLKPPLSTLNPAEAAGTDLREPGGRGAEGGARASRRGRRVREEGAAAPRRAAGGWSGGRGSEGGGGGGGEALGHGGAWGG